MNKTNTIMGKKCEKVDFVIQKTVKRCKDYKPRDKSFSIDKKETLAKMSSEEALKKLTDPSRVNAFDAYLQRLDEKYKDKKQTKSTQKKSKSSSKKFVLSKFISKRKPKQVKETKKKVDSPAVDDKANTQSQSMFKGKPVTMLDSSLFRRGPKT